MNEIKRMQQLAGINEIKVKDPTNPTFLIFNDIKKEYEQLLGTDPIYNGLDQVLTDPKLYDTVIENVDEIINDTEYDNEEEQEESRLIYTEDYTNRVIMEQFMFQFIQNLLDLGFSYDSDKDNWTVPHQYLDNGMRNSLTSYGIIWNIWGIKYDTNVREMIADALREAAADL